MSTLPHDDPRCVDEDAPSIELVIEGRPRGVDSITVARLLPAPQRRMVGPFIFLDHMGPVVVAPGVGFDVRPHPHIGLSTVTYFLEGGNVHRDNLGSVQKNVPGDVNLMTAGRGVVHSERADPVWRAHGGMMHGIQMWLALPLEHEDDAPSFEHHPEATLPAIAVGSNARGRVLIGSAFGVTSPIVHPSHPMLVDLELDAAAEVDMPSAQERAVLVIEGSLQVGDLTLPANRLAVLRNTGLVRVSTLTKTRLLVIGGPQLGPRFIEWNFVASTKDKIARASAAWKAQTFAKIPCDDQEYIPLPELHR